MLYFLFLVEIDQIVWISIVHACDEQTGKNLFLNISVLIAP